METMETIRDKAEQMSSQEGQATRQIEQVSAALPSSAWLVAAGASIIGSLVLKLSGRHQTANFVGQWAPTLLIIGLYNKLVKLAGSDRRTGASAFST